MEYQKINLRYFQGLFLFITKFTYKTVFFSNTPCLLYTSINAYEWLEDESLYIYLYQKEELEAFTDFFQNAFLTK